LRGEVGDEFLLLLPGVGYARARAVAERVQAGLELPFVYETGEVVVTVSIGVAIAPVHGRDAAALVRMASSGRDRAKVEGGNAVRVADTTASHDGGALQLEVELRQAIQNEEFELFYQPQVAVPSQEIVGAEALVRWRSPERGLVMPGEFIGALEQTGLIVPLGDWVVRQAAAQAAAWSRLRPGEFRVAVNVSARQLYHGDLLRTVREALAESELSPERLEVEVTETVAIQNPERAVSLLESLQEMGVHVSLDDFGTGHSWLNQLKRLPAMSLKIDRSFVAGVVEEAQDRAIVAGLIAVAHTLGLGVVAEGVERADQLAVVEEMQCDLVQGFYFSPAVPADEFELLLIGRPPWIAGRDAA
jgi:EAL domain-containing protein (putative c-di-GMP-specific phosphodiesterase class I)